MLRVTTAALNVLVAAGNVNDRPSMGTFGKQFVEHWADVVWAYRKLTSAARVFAPNASAKTATRTVRA
jgi:hypothetical protein